MSKKLVLVNPVNTLRGGFAKNALSKYPPLSLGIIASLTPPDWDIEILDENFENFNFRKADLVGITSFTSSACRAYQIAEEYRKKGVKVVMGGIHASILPDEALRYVDTVVAGEAEGSWGKVISDFENGKLQRLYKSDILDYKNWPIPRHDLFHKEYIFDSIQTTRGCPMQCDYCSVSMFNGNTFRQRPIDEVIEELKMIKRKLLFIVDDNIIGYGEEYEKRAIDLFNRMKQENVDKSWFSHASIQFANNEELMRSASESGCKLIYIGFEAEQDESLQEIRKTNNLKHCSRNYKKVVRRINKHKIGVIGGFMMGMDTDSEINIKKRKNYLLRCCVNIISLSCFTPLPGTVLYKRLEYEKRIIRNNYPEDWKYYDFLDTLYEPKNATAEELKKSIILSWKIVYHPFFIFLRTFKTLLQTRSIEISKWTLISNFHHRNATIKNNTWKKRPVPVDDLDRKD